MSRFVRGAGIVLAALGWPVVALGVTCKMPGDDFGKAAAMIAPAVIVSSSGTGHCDFTDNALVATALDSDQTCVAKFFPGLSLARPWLFSDVEVNGQGQVIVKKPKPDDRALELQLSVTAPAHKTRAATVMNIQMHADDKDKCPKKPAIASK